MPRIKYEPIDLEEWKRGLMEDEKQMIRKFIKRLDGVKYGNN